MTIKDLRIDKRNVDKAFLKVEPVSITTKSYKKDITCPNKVDTKGKAKQKANTRRIGN